MVTIVVATDADAVAAEVSGALVDDDVSVVQVRAGVDVEAAVLQYRPELVILDLQIGNMGGMACCMHLRNESGMGRMAHPAILMLLDRSADNFLAERAGADGWLIKPLDSFRLRKAAKALLEGDEYTESPKVETVHVP